MPLFTYFLLLLCTLLFTLYSYSPHPKCGVLAVFGHLQNLTHTSRPPALLTLTLTLTLTLALTLTPTLTLTLSLLTLLTLYP